MKTPKIALTFLLFVSASLFFQCRESQEEISSASKKREAEIGSQPNTNYSQSINTICDCSTSKNPYCPDCIDNLLDGGLQKSYTVSWDADCTNGCYIDPSNLTTVEFCYDRDPALIANGECGIIAKFSGLPACLAGCYLQDEICIKGKVHCRENSNDIAITGTYIGADNQTHNVDITYTFGNDPQVKVCCDNICCTGETLAIQ